MKYFATFAALVLLASGIQSLATHKHERHHNAHHQLQARAGDGCEWKCTDQNGNTVPADQLGGEWQIDLVGDAAISLYFNASTGVFVIWNKAINIVVVFYGNTRIMAVINISTNSGILVNLDTKIALYVTVASTIGASFAAGIYVGAQVIVGVITTNLTLMKSIFLATNANAFSLAVFIGWDLQFAFRAQLLANVKLAVGALISAVIARSTTISGWLSVSSYGALAIVIGVVGTASNVQAAYLSAFYQIVFVAGGFVSANAQLVFSYSYSISFYLGGLLAGSITKVVVLSTGALQFIGAAGQVLFAVSVSGAIVVAGAVVGVIGGAIQAAATGVLSALVSLSASVSFSIGFGASASIGK